MKKKHKVVLDKVKAGYKAEARVTDRQHMNNQELLKNRIYSAQMKLKTDNEKWQENLHKLDIALSTAKDKVYLEMSNNFRLFKNSLMRRNRL